MLIRVISSKRSFVRKPSVFSYAHSFENKISPKEKFLEGNSLWEFPESKIFSNAHSFENKISPKEKFLEGNSLWEFPESKIFSNAHSFENQRFSHTLIRSKIRDFLIRSFVPNELSEWAFRMSFPNELSECILKENEWLIYNIINYILTIVCSKQAIKKESLSLNKR